MNNELVNNDIIESTKSFETIKNLNIQDNIILKFEKDYNKLIATSYYGEKINNILLLLKSLFGDLGLLVLNFICFRFIMKNNLTMGNYMTITLLFNYILSPIDNFISLLNEYHLLRIALEE